ncbi:OTU-like cysteine protease [Xylariales sp. AK1849]|nr:OTU-like cysteine protease [Xylariales sp. AK1849]
METIEAIQARHRKEQRDLQSRITGKKRNATKKTRKGVNDECAELERQLKENQAQELATLNRASDDADSGEDGEPQDGTNGSTEENDEKPETNGISEQLGQASTPDPTPSPTDPPQAGKKRNRQKDRLARRAAEQEAAATAAEEEAATMTDHRKLEKTYLLKEFKANHLTEKEIQPDGHCLFSAVADQLSQNSIPLGPAEETQGKLPYKVVRKRATDHMEAHPEEFAPFLEEDFEGYVRKIRDTAEWGGQLELKALADAYGVEIKVLQDGRTETIEPRNQGEDTGRVWLAYYRHGYGLGEHYNSLRKAV